MTNVSKFYNDVIEDVVAGIKDEFVEDGGDIQVLNQLKKLWKSKLAETHVCDPEPLPGSSAQYVNLVQRSQVQIHPNSTLISTGPSLNLSNSTVGLPVRQLNTVIRTGQDQSSLGLAVPGSIASLRLPTVRSTAITLAAQNIRPVDTSQQSNAGLTSVILPTRPPTNRNLQQTNLLPAVMNANTGGPQPRSIATAVQPATAPQLATLPSGLTGHLVQIGQQTYLVPQHLTATAAVRQPGVQLAVPQFVSNPNILAANSAGIIDSKSFAVPDVSQFKQTQVDGGHDSDDDKFCDTPGSQPVSVPEHRKHHPTSRTNYGAGVTPNFHHASDLEDDDDDDDDLVPATPGQTPPSTRSHYNLARHVMDTPSNSEFKEPGDVTPFVSAPPTPMSPPSVSAPLRQSGNTVVRRYGNTSGSAVQPRSLKRKRRSPSIGLETEPDDDSEGCEDGEDAEIMTTTTMTPAGQNCELDEDNYDDFNSKQPALLGRNSKNRPRASRSTISPKNNHSVVAKQFLSPSESEIGIPEPVVPDEEVDALKAEEEEEEEEPLNSGDDVSDEEPEVLFESENVIVCQYDKIHRARNKWRFHLKDGIMLINGRDHVFQKAVGEAEW